ncbi:serine/threonine-protein kinase [Hyalangium sp.]|uniref:serine/threonine-protein kinase n=1 Tax=Hyalangium sp. TaxID=2028555 RepID=UPI002D711648|nr:serine/threonine-protein kinase [Hyalangium sp.]HYH99034.1 serine/threonine-protein kinase [Hyalangium sp.]
MSYFAPMATGCPEETELTDLVLGLLEPESLAQMERHLDGCTACRKLVAVLAGNEASLKTRTARTPSESGTSEQLDRGTELGRYVVLERIGMGGMGMVFAAHDPELDRKVALKLLRSDWNEGPGAVEARARLWREAQALARLSHPHVVSVHDVGMHGGRLFIAMDFVEGTTLSRWLRAAPRRWAEVLDCFVQAGRGLAAAHAGGLVHRDFKPDNVLVGQDGRVRVTDFGLARLSQRLPEEGLGGTSPGAASQAMTQQGTLMGTPAYMAPEQLEGQASDARSDQFSFCVALYEGLYGERPFTGDSLAALVRAIREGSPSAPGEGRVPSRVRRAILRGLAARPEERHPSMEALLAALTQRPLGERWRVVAACVGAAALVGAGAGFWGRSATRCTGFERTLVDIWDEGRKERLEAAFRSSGLPLAEQGWVSTSRRLEAYAASLAAMEKDSCEATHVRGEQSERLMDLRGACLDRRRGSLRAAVDLMLEGDKAVLERAPESAHALPDLLACADRSALVNVMPLPADPAVRQQLSELQATIAEATALYEAGLSTRALEKVKGALVGLRAAGYRPYEAAALHLQGSVEKSFGRFTEAGELFQQAQLAALAGRDDELLVHSLIGMVGAELQGKARIPEAERSLQLAQAALERLGEEDAPSAAGEFYLFRGHLHHRKGEHAQALADLRHCLALWEKALGPEHPRLAEPLTGLGLVHNGQGHYEEALARYQDALRLHQRAYGAQHPGCVTHMNNVATALRLAGKVDEAVTRYREALALSEQSMGSEHTTTSMVRVNLGDALQRQGKMQEALAEYEKALPGLVAVHGRAHQRVTAVLTSIGNAHADLGEAAAAEKAYAEVLARQHQALGPDHPDLALTYNNLGTVMLDTKRYTEARRLLQAARALWEKALGPDHPKMASVVQNLAKVDLEEGRLEVALVGFQRALEMRRKALGPEHPKVVTSLTLVGAVTHRLHGARAALEPLERAAALANKVQLPPLERGKALFALARALWETGEARPRALALAQDARAELAKTTQHAAKELREVEEWLAKR